MRLKRYKPLPILILASAHQLKDSNFGTRTEPDRETGGAYAAVDVELPAGFLEPSTDVASFYSGEGDAAMDELELAAVGVPGQGQVDAQLSSTIKGVGIVAQKDVDHLRHHQLFVPRKILINVVSRMIGGESQALIVNTNQVQHFAARLNRHPLLAQDANPLRGKKSRDGILGLCIDLMVAEATENPVGRTKRGECLNYFALRLSIISQVVSGQHNQASFQLIDEGDAA